MARNALICNGCKKEIDGDVEVHDALCEPVKALRRKTWQDFLSRQERIDEFCKKKDALLKAESGIFKMIQRKKNALDFEVIRMTSAA